MPSSRNKDAGNSKHFPVAYQRRASPSIRHDPSLYSSSYPAGKHVDRIVAEMRYEAELKMVQEAVKVRVTKPRLDDSQVTTS